MATLGHLPNVEPLFLAAPGAWPRRSRLLARLFEREGRRESWGNVDRNAGELVEDALDLRPDRGGRREGGCRLVITIGLQGHDLSRQAFDGLPHLWYVDRKRPVRRDDKCALIDQEIQLDRDASAMRFRDAEPNRSER